MSLPALPTPGNLPALLVLTDRRQAARPLRDVIAAVLDGGARMVVLREKDLAYDERARLADELAVLMSRAGGTLIVAGPQGFGRDVHLGATDAQPVPRPRLVGRSCHDLAEVTRAGEEGCDYVTVSPVHASPSKPGYGPPLGAAGLAALTRAAGAPPVYALGGITVANAADALDAGAAGVAMMGAVMRAARPDAYVAGVLRALGPQFSDSNKAARERARAIASRNFPS